MDKPQDVGVDQRPPLPWAARLLLAHPDVYAAICVLLLIALIGGIMAGGFYWAAWSDCKLRSQKCVDHKCIDRKSGLVSNPDPSNCE